MGPYKALSRIYPTNSYTFDSEAVLGSSCRCDNLNINADMAHGKVPCSDISRIHSVVSTPMFTKAGELIGLH